MNFIEANELKPMDSIGDYPNRQVFNPIRQGNPKSSEQSFACRVLAIFNLMQTKGLQRRSNLNILIHPNELLFTCRYKACLLGWPDQVNFLDKKPFGCRLISLIKGSRI